MWGVIGALMVILTLRVSSLNNLAQAMWLYTKLEAYMPIEPLRFGGDDDSYWIRVRTPHTRVLLEFLNTLPEVVEATPAVEESPTAPDTANPVVVALSPFSTSTASQVGPPTTM